MCCSSAPVKLPFSCPNSSLAISVGIIEPQSTASNGPLLRSDSLCSVRATTSLPVPVSPRMSTEVGAFASLAILAIMARIGSLSAMIWPSLPSENASRRVVSPSRMRSVVRPMRSVVPGRTRAFSIQAPLRMVPLVEPRSLITTLSPDRRSSRW